MKKVPLFVYGTLKKGYRAHHLIKGSRFLGFGYSTTEYKLLDCGSFPGLVKTEHGTNSIEGEIYEVDRQTLVDTHNYEAVSTGLFKFDFIGLDSVDIKEEPSYKLSVMMLNRMLCFTYLFNNPFENIYEEINEYVISS
jgi:gamma-glutamylcyclotransferase (GGCT)/AIG2-like uncharacterized protein YtfP